LETDRLCGALKRKKKKKKKEKQMVKGREWSGVRGRGVPEGK